MTMSDAALAKLTAFNQAQTDWKGVCRKCKRPYLGSLIDKCPYHCDEPHGQS